MSMQRVMTIVRLELTQRLRSVAWYVLLGVFAVVLIGVTALPLMIFSGVDEPGAGVYSVVVNIVLLLVVLISPTLSVSTTVTAPSRSFCVIAARSAPFSTFRGTLYS